jgi:DNA-binding transcriptional regulator LsrR (DeoR family)
MKNTKKVISIRNLAPKQRVKVMQKAVDMVLRKHQKQSLVATVLNVNPGNVFHWVESAKKNFGIVSVQSIGRPRKNVAPVVKAKGKLTPKMKTISIRRINTEKRIDMIQQIADAINKDHLTPTVVAEKFQTSQMNVIRWAQRAKENGGKVTFFKVGRPENTHIQVIRGKRKVVSNDKKKVVVKTANTKQIKQISLRELDPSQRKELVNTAVSMVMKQHIRPSEVARELHVMPMNIHNWVNKAKQESNTEILVGA